MLVSRKCAWFHHCFHICAFFVTVRSATIKSDDDDNSRSLYQFLDEPDVSAETEDNNNNNNVRRAQPHTDYSGAMSFWPGFGPKSPPAIDSIPNNRLLGGSSYSSSPYQTQYSPQSSSSYSQYGAYPQHGGHYPGQASPPVPSPYSSAPPQGLSPHPYYPSNSPGQPPSSFSQYPSAGPGPSGGPGYPSLPGYSPDADKVPRYPWDANSQRAPGPGNPYGGAAPQLNPTNPYSNPQPLPRGSPYGAQGAPQSQPPGSPYGAAQPPQSQPPGSPYGAAQPPQLNSYGSPQGAPPGPSPYSPSSGYPYAQPQIPQPQNPGFPTGALGGGPPPPSPYSLPQPSPQSLQSNGGIDPGAYPQLSAASFGGPAPGGSSLIGQASMYGNVNPLNSGPFNSGIPPGGPMGGRGGPANFGPQIRFSLAANKATYLTAPMLSPRGPPGPIIMPGSKEMGGVAPMGPPHLQGSMSPSLAPGPNFQPTAAGGPPIASNSLYPNPPEGFMASPHPMPGQKASQEHAAFPHAGAMAWPTSAFGAVATAGGHPPTSQEGQGGPFGLTARSRPGPLANPDASYESMGMNIASLPIDIRGGGIDFGNAIGPAYPATLSMQPPISKLDMNAAGMYGALVLDMEAVLDQDDLEQGQQQLQYTPGVSVGGSTYDYQQIQPEEEQTSAANTVMDALLQQVQRLRAVSYSRSDCEQCQAAEALLESAYNVPVTVFQMDKLAKGSEFLQFLGSITGSEQVPQIFICGYYIGGYEHVMKYHTSNKLNDFVKKCFDSPQPPQTPLSDDPSVQKEAKKEAKKDEKDA